MPTILKIARRELRRMASKPIYWFCMIAAPLFCFVFFTSLMAEGLPTDMPLGLVDNDNTTTSRSLARNLDAFEMTSIKEQYANVTEAREAVQRGDIYGFYYIPKGTTRKAQRQELPSFRSTRTILTSLPARCSIATCARCRNSLRGRPRAQCSTPKALRKDRRWPFCNPS